MPYTAKALAQQVAADSQLADRIAANPAQEIANAATPPPLSESTYKIVVIILGVVLLVALGAAIFLKDDVSDFIVAVGSGALGALAGLLAPSPTQ